MSDDFSYTLRMCFSTGKRRNFIQSSERILTFFQDIIFDKSQVFKIGIIAWDQREKNPKIPDHTTFTGLASLGFLSLWPYVIR